MALIMTSPPAVEPVTLQDAKLWLKVDRGEDDDLIADLISAARQNVERLTGKHLIEQHWTVFLDRWPDTGEIELPIMPVSAVQALATYSEDNVASLVDPSHYYASLADDPPRIVLRGSRLWLAPARAVNGIGIDLVTGFGPARDDVPEALRHALLRFVAAWYEYREAPPPGGHGAIPAGVMSALAQYRRVKL